MVGFNRLSSTSLTLPRSRLSQVHHSAEQRPVEVLASARQKLGVGALVDESPYQMSNICGALVPESLAVLSAVGAGTPVSEVRERALGGGLFKQRSWQARRRFWHAVHPRYFGHGVQWVIDDLASAAKLGPHDPTALGLLYLHFALRDHLTLDWIIGPVWARWSSGQVRLTRDDVRADLAVLLEEHDIRWTESSRDKHATSLLSALRDYGLARGVVVKHLQRPVLTRAVSTHLTRILVERGVRGASLVEHPYWRLYFRTPDDVASELLALSMDRVIRFERAGSTVVLETPWSVG